MTPAKDLELIRQQLGALIGLYQHHLDLFWKWITLYATIVTALTVYIFNKEITPATRRAFPILIAVASLGISFGCYIMWSWLKELEREVKRQLRILSLLSVRLVATRSQFSTACSKCPPQ